MNRRAGGSNSDQQRLEPMKMEGESVGSNVRRETSSTESLHLKISITFEKLELYRLQRFYLVPKSNLPKIILPLYPNW